MAVPAAFRRAGAAKRGTQPAYFCRLPASEAQQLGGGMAQRRAFHIELYAIRHHPDVVFPEARRRTVLAEGRASEARLDAVLEGSVVVHWVSVWDLTLNYVSCILKSYKISIDGYRI